MLGVEATVVPAKAGIQKRPKGKTFLWEISKFQPPPSRGTFFRREDDTYMLSHQCIGAEFLSQGLEVALMHRQVSTEHRRGQESGYSGIFPHRGCRKVGPRAGFISRRDRVGAAGSSGSGSRWR